jgi:threonine/homoserine/homoserine lactone efflux protein
VLSLSVTGFLLGWSIAWPPGPVNAEIARRGVTRGFWAAYGLALGACTGDAVWALMVGLGASAALSHDATRTALWLGSTAMLVVVAIHLARGAARSWSIHRKGGELVFERPARFESTRAGYLLGVALTLTSPLNIAFWLAVMGRPELAGHGLAAALVLALSVIAGAATWSAILSAAAVVLRSRSASPWWDILTRVAAALFLIYFALRSLFA